MESDVVLVLEVLPQGPELVDTGHDDDDQLHHRNLHQSLSDLFGLCEDLSVGFALVFLNLDECI